MRAFMAAAPVGDDVYGEDPSIIDLEKKVASIFGFEAGLLVPTGTMGNLISQISHCSGGPAPWEAFVGSASHVALSEGGGAAFLGGLYHTQLPTRPDGTFSLAQLVRSAHVAHARTYPSGVLSSAGLSLSDIPRGAPVNVHHAATRMLCVEDTHNFMGGVPLSDVFKQNARAACDELGISLHCDGARIWNSVVATRTPAASIGTTYDTMSVCLSKGLGCPVGSVVVGPRAFVERARHWRKVVGGGMRQAGIVAAAAIHQLNGDWEQIFVDDHTHARRLADAIEKAPAGSPLRLVRCPETNIVLFEVLPEGVRPSTAADLADTAGDPYGTFDAAAAVGGVGTDVGRAARAAALRLEHSAESARSTFLKAMSAEGVLLSAHPIGPKSLVRAVTHLDISDQQLERAIDVMLRYRV